MRCRMTWNLSYTIFACGAFRRAELRKAFHMSITTNLMPVLISVGIEA